MIYDFRSALHHLYRILKPGGLLLTPLMGSAKWDDGRESINGVNTGILPKQFMRRQFQELFAAENVTVESRGSELSTIAFLHGLAMEELSKAELDHHDPDYELLITVRAVKP